MTKNEEKWLANYESFKSYIVSNTKMPGSNVKSSIGTSLEGWYRNQKDKYNEGKLAKNEVFLFNKIVPGMLEKSVQEINLELYLRYRKCVYDKYNPEVVHLYRKCAIDYSFAKECIVRGKYTLVDILQSYKNPDELLHHCLKAIYNLPNMGICQLYCYIIGERGVSELYLKDSHRFIDYYVIVLNNFNNDYNKIAEILKLTPRDVGIINMYCAGCTQEEIGKKYNITRERVKQIFAKSVRRMRSLAVYNDSGTCTFGGDTTGFGEPEVKDIDKSKMVNPYTQSFESMSVLSVRSFNCLRRMNIHNFEDLHNFLVSVDVGATGNYIGGLSKVRNLGARSAKEVYDLSVELGVADRVFLKQE